MNNISNSKNTANSKPSQKQQQLSNTAYCARALLFLAFSWVLFRGYQLRHEIFQDVPFPPGDDEQQQQLLQSLLPPNDHKNTQALPRGIITNKKTKKKMDTTTTLSSCLLIGNDNEESSFQFSKWLQYHASRVPLDYLVVAVPSKSMQLRIQKLVDDQQQQQQQKRTNNDILPTTIVIWNDVDDLFPSVSQTKKNGRTIDNEDDKNDATHHEEQRRQLFMEKCKNHLIENERNSWISFHDDNDSDTTLSFKEDGAEEHNAGEAGGKQSTTRRSLRPLLRRGET
eukprot:CAMPEP_0194244632 /NCGR_PEP_ID=MMETSP0158-20130606/11661_1 /TAXON_ID=33649 /ORGANISM="Thalassionema nitzschioides, Strain L26-B" /LENGTH=282 /DNA_ID=CAMNT_0038980181 /DNA_START=218 /DNA_END=1066 /DNA_ORIENTATION=-